RIAKSIVDYLFRWLAIKFLSDQDNDELGVNHFDPSNGNGIDRMPESTSAITQSKKTTTKLEIDTDGDHQPDATYTKKIEESISALAGGDAQITFEMQVDAPPCGNCGMIMVRNGSCYKCLNCGGTSGCS
ncbi:MAG: Vitamin B12-dependent ribonucleotide reductase, partial [Candidatus Komeilibacteria bacterium CG_4_9_14_3_um_filter_37_5]